MRSRPRHKLFTGWFSDLLRAYPQRPTWLFGFHAELSHGDSGISRIDEDMAEWLLSLQSEGHLEHTILIFMSDHGPRFAATRKTLT